MLQLILDISDCIRSPLLSQRIEKSDQRGPFVRAQLCNQANGFQQGTSGLPIAGVWLALLTLAGIVLRNQLLQCRGHVCQDVGRGFVSDCQHAAAFGANPGAN